MKIYIAGPMTGIDNHNYPAFVTAAGQLIIAGHEPLNPVDSEWENPTPGAPQPWEWYMRRAVRMLSEADGVALLPGWENGRGARLEAHIAAELGMHLGPLNTWLTWTAVPA